MALLIILRICSVEKRHSVQDEILTPKMHAYMVIFIFFYHPDQQVVCQ